MAVEKPQHLGVQGRIAAGVTGKVGKIDGGSRHGEIRFWTWP
jgi:hypothetical protein